MDEPNVVILGNLDNYTAALPDPSLWMYYQDLDNRVLWLDGEVCEDTLDFIKYILKWNREDKGKPIEERKPIKIFVHSPGGNLDVADTLINIIKLSATPIYSYAMGMVASAASLIYLAGHKRFALPNAYFLLHQGSVTGMGGDYSTVKAAMEDYEKTVEKMTQYYIDNTEFTEQEIRDNIKSDWYLYVEEAKTKHIITDELDNIDLLL